jgi:peptidoglycan/xylan/chitin deacetylase (PgdA/CDA1 family)
MLEVVLSLAIVFALVGAGLAVWRSIRGPARGRWGTFLRMVVLSLVAASLVAGAEWRYSKSRTSQLFGEIVPRVETSAPVVALTFDDGPTQYTEEILALLREEGVRATFFVTGQEVERNTLEARRIVAEGHELGNHSYSHQHMVYRSLFFIRQEIERTDGLIRAAGYERDIHVRAPYCKKLALLPYYLSVTERKSITFDVEPESYPEVAGDADAIAAHVLERARPGSIILLHVMQEGRAESRRAIPGVVRGLRDRGYSFVTVSELLAFPSKLVLSR